MWDNGELTYDAFSKSTFTLKPILLWTISDFPAHGTDSMWLKLGRKHVFMCHRKGLPPTHSFRVKKSWFDGKAEHGRKRRILSGQEISQT